MCKMIEPGKVEYTSCVIENENNAQVRSNGASILFCHLAELKAIIQYPANAVYSHLCPVLVHLSTGI